MIVLLVYPCRLRPAEMSFINGDFKLYLIQISSSLEPEFLGSHNAAGEWKVAIEFARGLFELLVSLSFPSSLKAAAEKQYCAILFFPSQPLLKFNCCHPFFFLLIFFFFIIVIIIIIFSSSLKKKKKKQLIIKTTTPTTTTTGNHYWMFLL